MRKKVTYEDKFRQFKIQTFNPPGAYISILCRIYLLINYTLSKHSRVLVNGFCAKYPVDDGQLYTYRDLSNDTFLDFLEEVRDELWDQGFDPIILWCREQENELDEFNNPAHPHWHFTILTDGNVNQSINLFRVHQIWNKYLGLPADAKGYIDQCKLGVDSLGFKMHRDDPPSIARVFRAMSYLSKCKTKELTPAGLRMYGSSEILNRKPHKRKKRKKRQTPDYIKKSIPFSGKTYFQK